MLLRKQRLAVTTKAAQVMTKLMPNNDYLLEWLAQVQLGLMPKYMVYQTQEQFEQESWIDYPGEDLEVDCYWWTNGGKKISPIFVNITMEQSALQPCFEWYLQQPEVNRVWYELWVHFGRGEMRMGRNASEVPDLPVFRHVRYAFMKNNI